MTPCYRVEYRRGPVVLTLDHVTHVYLHHTTLSPYVTWLHLEHGDAIDGEVVLVDEATGQVVARRRVGRPTRKPARISPQRHWETRRLPESA